MWGQKPVVCCDSIGRDSVFSSNIRRSQAPPEIGDRHVEQIASVGIRVQFDIAIDHLHGIGPVGFGKPAVLVLAKPLVKLKSKASLA